MTFNDVRSKKKPRNLEELAGFIEPFTVNMARAHLNSHVGITALYNLEAAINRLVWSPLKRVLPKKFAEKHAVTNVEELIKYRMRGVLNNEHTEIVSEAPVHETHVVNLCVPPNFREAYHHLGLPESARFSILEGKNAGVAWYAQEMQEREIRRINLPTDKNVADVIGTWYMAWLIAEIDRMKKEHGPSYKVRITPIQGSLNSYQVDISIQGEVVFPIVGTFTQRQRVKRPNYGGGDKTTETDLPLAFLVSDRGLEQQIWLPEVNEFLSVPSYVQQMSRLHLAYHGHTSFSLAPGGAMTHDPRKARQGKKALWHVRGNSFVYRHGDGLHESLRTALIEPWMDPDTQWRARVFVSTTQADNDLIKNQSPVKEPHPIYEGKIACVGGVFPLVHFQTPIIKDVNTYRFAEAPPELKLHK